MLSNNLRKHTHEYKKEGNMLICECGKKKLLLKNREENISEGIRSNGVNYSVRNDRHRYFFPEEWNKFIKEVTNETHKLMFLTLLNSGARIMEALHLKPKDFNFERGTITFNVIKSRKAKANFLSIQKSRTFFISPKYLKYLKSLIIKSGIDADDYLFMDKSKLPANYEQLTNNEKRPYYQKYEVSYSALLKRKLKKAGIKDWKNFSLHNLRKTYGNWMRIFDIKTEEICYRLGHDMQTYFTNYGSPLIFTPQDKQEIIRILGEVK